MGKIYCKDCDFYDCSIRLCEKRLDDRKYSKYSSEVISGSVNRIYLCKNNLGDCKYYKPKLIRRILDKFKKT